MSKCKLRRYSAGRLTGGNGLVPIYTNFIEVKGKPEGGCDQGVHAAACCLQEDVQQEVHIQFDSEPEKEQPSISNKFQNMFVNYDYANSINM